MKKIILILLCLPFFLFSQEERKYERTMSFSQFAKELKLASKEGNDVIFENCEIIFHQYRGAAKGANKFIVKNIQFSDKSILTIKNCKFSRPKEIENSSEFILSFSKCDFGILNFEEINAEHITIDSVSAEKIIFSCKKEELINPYNISILFSKIKKLQANSYIKNKQNAISIWEKEPSLLVFGNEIRHTNVYGFNNFLFQKNKAAALVIGDNRRLDNIVEEAQIYYNEFSGETNFELIKIYDPTLWSAKSYNGIYAYNTNFKTLRIGGNKINNTEKINNEIFDQIKLDVEGTDSIRLAIGFKPLDSIILEKDLYNESWSIAKKKKFIKQYLNERDITIIHDPAQFLMYSCKIENTFMYNNNINHVFIAGNIFEEIFTLESLKADSVVFFTNNTLPANSNVTVDEDLFKNFGYMNNNVYSNINFQNTKYIYGNEEYKEIKEYIRKLNSDSIFDKDAWDNNSSLIASYSQFIIVLKEKGNTLSDKLIIKLKDIQSNVKMYAYYDDPNIEKWFNWKGSEFLKWYSDYGMNPFKALSYCFKAMLWFALFYFFFYSDWDKIDRGFLIKRFNSVMDYFTTEKRIKDFYSTTHDKEMTTFTEFKNTLDKNKVHMPSMLASLAKPIYQMSLLRYKFLNFSYKKAEFMAGRKWVDLNKKDRYLIGTLTFFLTLTYIIYLISIRALNSIALSVNAFSTLGFGQIPVRGFTKYVAIIEGFIGWFMLSVFIVSLLSQMMSV